ncbi:DUF6247 family protein [Streptomyces goshikiensis]|uniref:DUF6247 family protein n=1 Tax=Streptomyces goshikiensis TaxID=1942 RepID=UPI0033F1A759
MSAQHANHVTVLPYVPAPRAPAELLALPRDDRRADTWVPASERDWAKDPQDARRTFSLNPLREVVRTWQPRVAAAPAVGTFMDCGRGETGFVDLDDVLGRRS